MRRLTANDANTAIYDCLRVLTNLQANPRVVRRDRRHAILRMLRADVLVEVFSGSELSLAVFASELAFACLGLLAALSLLVTLLVVGQGSLA